MSGPIIRFMKAPPQTLTAPELARVLQAYYRTFVAGVTFETGPDGQPRVVVHFAQGSENGHAPARRLAASAH